jgi:hypothetical protein
MSLQLEIEAATRFPSATPAGRDFKAWAKRFLWRLEQGDKTLTTIQIRFAKEAMGVSDLQAAA